MTFVTLINQSIRVRDHKFESQWLELFLCEILFLNNCNSWFLNVLNFELSIILLIHDILAKVINGQE